MKFYDKNKKQFVEFGDSFIEQYAKAYYYPENGKIDQPLINLLSKGCPVVVSILREKLIVY